jgi:peroxiredoxin
VPRQLNIETLTGRRSVLRSLLLGVAVTTALGACGSNNPDPGTAATAVTSVDTAVPEALRFTAPLVGGGEFDGSAVAGRPIAFWFWAPTWSTCNREAPSVEAARKQWAGKVDFYGVAWSGDESSFQDFVDRHTLTFPQISDDEGNVYTRFGIPTQPALALVDSDGEVQTVLGALDDSALESALLELTSP